MFKVCELLKAAKAKLLSGDANTEVSSICIDSRIIKPEQAFVAIKGLNFDGHNFINEAVRKGAKAVIAQGLKPKARVSRNIAFLEVKDTTIALGDIARRYRARFNIPVIAVTGSNGKTSTKEMIAWALSGRFNVLKNEGTKNNQIGLPLTLLNLNGAHQLAVLEAGTNHPGELEYLAGICRPNIAVITNIGCSHLEYFKDLKGVFGEKIALIKHLQDPRIALLNSDDSFLKSKTGRAAGRPDGGPVIFGFGSKNKTDFFASRIKVINKKISFLVNQKYIFSLNTIGGHNVHNALAAIAVGRIFGIEYRSLRSRLSNFVFPQDRLQLLELNNIKFINDTYNSNPVSLSQALGALDNFRVKGRKIFVMGDMLELGIQEELFHHRAGQEAARVCDVFITVGGLSKAAARGAIISGFDSRKIFACASNLEARDILFKKVSPGPDDIVLLKGSRGMKLEEILKAQ